MQGYTIFLIFAPKHRLWVLVRTASASNMYPQFSTLSLQKELDIGRKLLEEALQGQSEIKIFYRLLSNCIRRLHNFNETLIQSNEKLSISVSGQNEAQEVDQLITEDWSFIAEVDDCRYKLEDILQSLPDQGSSKLTNIRQDNSNQMIHIATEMQPVRPDFFYFLVLGRFLTKVWIGGENKNKNIS